MSACNGWHDCAHWRCWIQVSPYSVYCDMHQREYEAEVLRRVLDGVADGSTKVTECMPRREWEKESKE